MLVQVVSPPPDEEDEPAPPQEGGSPGDPPGASAAAPQEEGLEITFAQGVLGGGHGVQPGARVLEPVKEADVEVESSAAGLVAPFPAAEPSSAGGEREEQQQQHTPTRTPDLQPEQQEEQQLGADGDVAALLAAAAANVALAAGEGEQAEGDEVARVPPPKAAPAPAPTAEQAARAAAGALLQQVLDELLAPGGQAPQPQPLGELRGGLRADPDVAAALRCLRGKPLPAHAQLLASGAVPELVLRGGALGAGAGGEGGEEEQAAGGGLAVEQEDAALAAVFRDPAFQELAEFVLSSTVTSLIEECAADEWEAPPTSAGA